MDFSLSEQEKELQSQFDAFFKEEMKNAPPEYGNGGLEGVYATEEGFAFHKYMAKKLAEKGWISMAWPKEYGGRGASIMEQVLFNQSRGYHDAPGIDGFAVGMFAPTLMVGATDEQKARLLPPIANGEAFYCQGWSEPDAGSDLASLTTTAIRDGDEYVVNGQKTWTTGGHRAEFMFLLARTDPDSKRGKGLSVFHHRMDLPGIEVRPLLYMDGKHVYNEVFFKDVRIPAKDLIGVEGEGWALTRQTMNFERSGSHGLGASKRKLEEMIHYVKATKRDGKLLANDPIVRQKLAKLHIDTQMGESLASKIAWLQRKNDMSSVITAASEAKIFTTELGQRVSNFSTEIMGQYGQLEESKWAPLNGSMVELYQFSVGQNIYAGSNEIQRNLIAWTGLGLPRMKMVK
jgi:alkylation response protein AidB-like acyl-CoA dehydrogenase